MNPEFAFTPALELAQLIRSKEISPLELTEFYLERIERLDVQIGSFYHIASETALTDARTKTEQLAKTSDTNELPLFFGVPIALKDLVSIAGMPTSYGVAALRNNVTEYDEAIVTKIKNAGLIILGKTATSQLGSFPYTEPPGFSPTRNPWNLEYTSGGSSGGAAAAVAAGLCPIAQGSDGGGSIRIPAKCCGVVGIKPARGRVSYAPLGEHQSGIATNGPIARTVADAAALLDVLSGYIIGDPYWLPSPPISFLEATHQPLSGLRMAVITDLPPFSQATAVCQQALQQTTQHLEAMGHFVTPGELRIEGLIEPFQKIWQAGIPASGIPLELLCPFNRWLAENAGTVGSYLQAVRQMHLISRQIVAYFEQVDVLLLPVCLHQPFKIGALETLPPSQAVEAIINWVAPCPPFNASGLPAIALPTGLDEEGLPVGIQLVGKPAAEVTLIALAAQLEAVNPWNHYHPPLTPRGQGDPAPTNPSC